MLHLGYAALVMQVWSLNWASSQPLGERMSDVLVSINTIARESGVASSALRYYERCGLISAGIKIGGRRHYPPAILQRLSVIKVCQKIGFSLAEIAELLDGRPGREGAWREVAQVRRSEVQRQIKELQHLLELLDAAMECTCHRLYECPKMGPNGHIAARSPAGGHHPEGNRNHSRPGKGATASGGGAPSHF